MTNADERPKGRAAAQATTARQRLTEAGYRLTHDGQFEPGEIERATAGLLSKLAPFGPVDVLQQLLGQLRERGRYGFGVYLTAREFSLENPRPALPYGFLINLAARLSLPPTPPSNPATAWRAAMDLAMDIAVTLNVQAYSQIWMINVGPERLVPFLRDCALFDHVFTLRQWPWASTLQLIKTFFGAFDVETAMRQRLGWSVVDALRAHPGSLDSGSEVC